MNDHKAAWVSVDRQGCIVALSLRAEQCWHLRLGGRLDLSAARPVVGDAPLVGLLPGCAGDVLYVLQDLEASSSTPEREILARELHDGVGQTLSALKMAVGALRRERQLSTDGAAQLERIEGLAQQAWQQFRRVLSSRLAADEQDLVQALRRIIAHIEEHSALRVETSLDGGSLMMAAEDLEHILNIVREALTNVLRHAGVLRANLELGVGDGQLRLSVSDQGVGFEPDPDLGEHYGLKLMRSRAKELGADLQILSAVGEGCRLVLTLPWLPQD